MGAVLGWMKRTGICTLAGAVLMGLASTIDVIAAEQYPLIYGKVRNENEPHMILTKDAAVYKVLPGDSLWKIAKMQLGDGNYYVELAEANRDVLSDSNLLYPGMELNVSKSGYISRVEAEYGGFQTPKYSFDFPHDWRVGYAEAGNAFANLAIFGDGEIVCLVQDRKKETAGSVLDWDKCTQQIADYASRNYSRQVSDLRFEHYHMENQGDGTGELYLYSYIWHISPDDYPGFSCEVTVGLKLTEHVQAEFVGYATKDYDIQSCIRYVAASFEEHYEPDSAGNFTVNDSNMTIYPESEWEVKGMYNSFSYVDEFFSATLNEVEGNEVEEKTPNEKLIDRLSGK